MENASRTAQHSVAQCVAVLCIAAGEGQVKSTVEGLLSTLQVIPQLVQTLQAWIDKVALQFFTDDSCGFCSHLEKLAFSVFPCSSLAR